MKVKELLNAIKHYEELAELYRYRGCRLNAAKCLRQAKELKILLALAD